MSSIKITKDNFETEVRKAPGTGLVDFWAEWCMPCKMLAPIVEQVAEENPDIKVGKINVDEEKELAAEFQIMSIPTLIVFKDGKAVKISSGLRPKEEIEKML